MSKEAKEGEKTIAPASNVNTFDFTDISRVNWYQLFELCEVVTFNQNDKVMEAFTSKSSLYCVLRGRCEPEKDNKFWSDFSFDRDTPIFGENSFICGGSDHNVICSSSFAQVLVMNREKVFQQFNEDYALQCKLLKFVAAQLASKVLDLESSVLQKFNLTVH